VEVNPVWKECNSIAFTAPIFAEYLNKTTTKGWTLYLLRYCGIHTFDKKKVT
jgi:hypothetical protein